MTEVVEIPVEEIHKPSDQLVLVDQPASYLPPKSTDQKQEYEATNQFTFTPKDVLEAEWYTFVKAAVPQLEEGRKPSYDHSVALFRKYIKDRIYTTSRLYYSEDEEDELNFHEAIKSIHVPIIDIQDQERTLVDDLPKNSWDQETSIKQGESKLFPLGFHTETYDEVYDYDKLQLCDIFISRLSEEDRVRLSREIAPFLISEACTHEELNSIMRNLLPENFDELNSTEKLKITRVFFDSLWSIDLDSIEFESIDYIEDEDSAHLLGTNIGDKIFGILQESVFQSDIDMAPWLLYLSEKDDFNKLTTLLGKSIVPRQFPTLLNNLRNLLKHSDLTETQKSNLTKIGKILTGHEPEDDVDFFTSLDELYHTISFENYKPNQHATELDADLIDSITSQFEGKKRVLDLGCGTGRHLVELEKRQKDKSEEEKNEYIGLETNPRHVLEARKALGNESQVIEGSWYNIPLEDSSLDIIYCVGRNLPHVETEEQFREVMAEVQRVLKPGGVILFDMPDPNKGAYIKAQKVVRNALERLHVYPELVDNGSNRFFSYIVDGPGEGKVYNRYAPNIEDIPQLVKDSSNKNPKTFLPLHTMHVTEVTRSSIEDGEDSENVYLLGYKPDLHFEDPEVAEVLNQYHEKMEEYHSVLDQIQELKQKKQAIFDSYGEIKVLDQNTLEIFRQANDDPEFQKVSDQLEELEPRQHSLWYELVGSSSLNKGINNFFQNKTISFASRMRQKIHELIKEA